MLLSIFLYGFLLTSKSGDTLFCNSKNPSTDRILFYDKDCFIWIRQHVVVSNELLITYGQYKSIGDTIYFSNPDSTRQPNKYFCYSSTKDNSKKDFHFYNTPETYPPFSIDRVYKAMFKSATPHLGETTFSETFQAIKKNRTVIIEDGLYEDSKFTKFIISDDSKKK